MADSIDFQRLGDGTCNDHGRWIEPTEIVSSMTPLIDLLPIMKSRDHLFVLEGASLDSHGGETGNDSTILAIISLPPDVDFLLVFKVFVSLSQLVLFSLYVSESWN